MPFYSAVSQMITSFEMPLFFYNLHLLLDTYLANAKPQDTIVFYKAYQALWTAMYFVCSSAHIGRHEVKIMVGCV